MALGVLANTVPGEVATLDRERGRLNGLLDLDFKRDSASGRTVLVRSMQIPPLRVVRAFAREDGSALAHLHNVSGGVLGGDRLVLRARLGRGTDAQLTTTGATRIYRPRTGAPTSAQINEIVVEEDGLLEYVPDAILPFAGARFSQRTTIQLAPGAGLFWWEILAPGREASGEIFRYEQVELITEVYGANRLIAAERMRLEPANGDIHSIARLGDYRYLATFYICRVGVPAQTWIAAEERLREVARAIGKPGEAVWGISTLAADGLAVRGLSRRSLDAYSGLRAIWQAAKLLLYGRQAIPPRKVH